MPGLHKNSKLADDGFLSEQCVPFPCVHALQQGLHAVSRCTQPETIHLRGVLSPGVDVGPNNPAAIQHLQESNDDMGLEPGAGIPEPQCHLLYNMQLPVKSQYADKLSDNMNLGIMLGTVQKLQEAMVTKVLLMVQVTQSCSTTCRCSTCSCLSSPSTSTRFPTT